MDTKPDNLILPSCLSAQRQAAAYQATYAQQQAAHAQRQAAQQQLSNAPFPAIHLKEEMQAAVEAVLKGYSKKQSAGNYCFDQKTGFPAVMRDPYKEQLLAPKKDRPPASKVLTIVLDGPNCFYQNGMVPELEVSVETTQSWSSSTPCFNREEDDPRLIRLGDLIMNAATELGSDRKNWFVQIVAVSQNDRVNDVIRQFVSLVHPESEMSAMFNNIEISLLHVPSTKGMMYLEGGQWKKMKPGAGEDQICLDILAVTLKVGLMRGPDNARGVLVSGDDNTEIASASCVPWMHGSSNQSGVDNINRIMQSDCGVSNSNFTPLVRYQSLSPGANSGRWTNGKLESINRR